MNKGRRNEIKFLKYKKRIKRWVANCSIYDAKDGRQIYYPKAIDLINDRSRTNFKNTGTICSCWMCSKYWKYKRHIKKQEDHKLISEGLKLYQDESYLLG
jgi:hypothetical protein